MKVLGNLILILLLATIVVPVGYLAWRAGQPMDLPQFKGYTYYQYLNWRKDALHQMAVEYQAAHPNAKMSGGLDVCFQDEMGVTLGLSFPLSGFYALAGAFPNLEKYVPPQDRKYIPQEITLWTYLPAWWDTYENLLWYFALHVPHTSIAYCRLEPNILAPALVTRVGQSLTESETRIK